MLISDLAGRSNIVMKARELGFDVSNDTPELSAMLQRIKELEHDGYEFESARTARWPCSSGARCAASADAVHGRRVSRVDAVETGDASVCEATVKVRVGDDHAHTVADGDGPVNALDAALRSALVTFYPHLEDVRLTDYKVRIIDSSSGTRPRARACSSSRATARPSGAPIGVNENIIEASLQALVDSLEYALLRKDFAAAVVRV